MVGAVVSNLRECQFVAPGRELSVAGIHIGHKLRCVSLAPSRVPALPGKTFGVYLARDPVKTDARQGFIARQNQEQISERVLQFALLVAGQPACPVSAGKVRNRPLAVFGEENRPHSGVLYGKFAHRLERRLFLKVAELVDAHEVESVQQFPACRVGSVVGVGELVIVDHHAGEGICGSVLIAPFYRGRLIELRQELLHRRFDPVGAAERTNHTVLFKRILLSADFSFHNLRLAARNRPLTRIAPVGVKGEVLVRVQRRAIVLQKHELPV